MKKYLLPNNGKFYKANLHMHTNVSDGNLTIEETKRLYQEKGYSVVAFTDHEIMLPHSELSDDSFLAITSTEISFNNSYEREFEYNKCYHLNLYSKNPLKDCYSTFSKRRMWLKHSEQYITKQQEKIDFHRIYSLESVNQIIKMAKEEKCLVSYNHPVWSLQNYNDYIGIKGLWGVEWYNTGCVRLGYEDSFQVIDDLLRVGENVFPLATDDAHKLDDCFSGWVMIKSNKLDYDNIFDALEKGDFYSSTGPEIKELYIEDGVINILSSEVNKVILNTERRYTKVIENENISKIQIDINDYLNKSKKGENDNQYIRITLIDKNNKKAHTRAYWFKELL